MAKPTQKSKPKSRATTVSASKRQTEILSSTPLGARERVFAISKLLLKELKWGEVRDAELWALIEEQFMPPAQRAQNRYMRKADEMLAQKLENDPRFQEAMSIAKGDVF